MISRGSRLGPYEVTSPLGAGGMGEVFRAWDTRLSREVAIKVLPAEVATDPARLKRFEKEARSASSLNHPNIVTIYEIGHADSVSYIAMELVEGKTLREGLSAGALPMRRLLSIGAQVADGLAKAHASGIVHRDLKPENIMVTEDGFAKILDFGLAKLTQKEPESGEHTKAATVSAGTEPGVVMGTVGYMSPEQAVGQALDFRSDQFSFGSVLYEMATGKRAFSGKTKPETLAAIIREEPEPIATLNPKVPAPLRWIIERCQAKEPKERYASTEDLARDLASVRDRLSEAGASGAFAAPAARRRSILLPVAILAALAAGAILTVVAGRSFWSTPQPRFRQLTFSSGVIQNARFAADGQTIVFCSQRPRGKSEILTTQPDSTESRSLGLPPSNILSVSRSGEMALLLGSGWKLGTLARVPLAGGAPREILENVQGADWSPDGSGLVVIHSVEGKYRVEFPIGHVLYESQRSVNNARFSPKGGLIALAEGGSVSLVDLKGSNKPRPSGASAPFAWSPTGEEIWSSREARGVTTVEAVGLGGRKRRIVSLPGAFILHDVSRASALLMERYAFQPTMVGLLPGDANERDLTWLDGSVPADISTDGRLVLFTEVGAGGGPARGVYIWRAADSQAVRLGDGTALALSPDGHWALATGDSQTRLALLPTGPGEPRSLDLSSVHPGGLGNVHFPVAGTFFPDGKRVLVTGFEEGRGKRLYVVDLVGGQPRPIGPEGAFFTDGAHGVSPDGAFVAAFGPDQTAHLFSVDGGADGAKPPIPGAAPGEEVIRWCADGRCVFVFGKGGNIYRLAIRTGRRDLWKRFSTTDEGGPGYVLPTPDGKWYAYGYSRYSSNLFLIDGVK